MGEIIIPILISTVLGIGIAVLSSLLFKPKTPNFIEDDTPTTLTSRGAYVPLVFGRARIGPIFAWAGDRDTKTTRSGGGGKGGGGGGGSSRTDYFESGWHLICVGPIDAIEKVWEDGEVVAENITAAGTPSGSNVSAGGEGGNFDVYYGELNQPVNELLGESSRVGVRSRWPYVAYVHWIRKKLGTSPRWQNLNYQVLCKPKGPAIPGAGPSWIGESSPGAGDDGANPAYVLHQVMTATYPHGCGVDPSLVDMAKLAAFGALCVQEQLAINMPAKDGIDAARALADMIQDWGVMIPQIGRFLCVHPIREEDPDALPEFTQDEVSEVSPEVTLLQGDKKIDRLVFSFTDRTQNYRRMTVTVDDDGLATSRGRSKPRQINMPTADNIKTGSLIVDRRQQEELVRLISYKLDVARHGRVLAAGQAIRLEGVGVLRAASLDHDLDTSRVLVNTVVDAYSFGKTGYEAPGGGGEAPNNTPEIDLAFDWWQAPLGFRGIDQTLAGQNLYAVTRLRAHDNIAGADVYLAASAGASFRVDGQQNASAAGGTLNDELPENGYWAPIEGPTITTSVGRDMSGLEDLSGDDAAYVDGALMCSIGDELFLLRSVTVVAPNTWRLNGLHRGRFDTRRERHPIGSDVYIWRPDDLLLFRNPTKQRIGLTPCVKSLPFTSSGSAELSDVTAVCRDTENRASSPLPVAALVVNKVTDTSGPDNAYASGGDVVVEWLPRLKENINVANASVPGQAIDGYTGTPTPDDFFYVEVWDVDRLTKIRDLIGPTQLLTVTYTNAQLVADFGGEPASFRIVAYAMGGPAGTDDRLTSREQEIVVTLE